MPIQDDFGFTHERNDKKRVGDLILPLWHNEWHAKRTSRIRQCSDTGKTIWPFQTAFAQDTFWGLSNAETHEEVETEWLSAAAYTFKKLKGEMK